MRHRRVWLYAGLLILAAGFAVPIGLRLRGPTHRVAARRSGSSSTSKGLPSAARDFKRTLTSAQVAERVTLLEMPDPAEERQNIETLLQTAALHFMGHHYSSAEDVADVVLALAPRYLAAWELKVDSVRACINGGSYQRFSEIRGEHWAPVQESMARSMPVDPRRDELAVHPSRKEWSDLIAWARNPMSARPPLPESIVRKRKEDDSAEILAIQHKLDTLRIDLDFTDSTLYDIVDFIQEFAKINLVVSAEVRNAGIPDRKIDFAVRDMVLKEVLRQLLERYDLGYTLENRVLLVTTAAIAAERPLLEVHDIRDLVASGKWSAGKIGAMVREHIAPRTWTEREGEVLLAIDEEGRLVIAHVPQVQTQIREFLEGLRKEK